MIYKVTIRRENLAIVTFFSLLQVYIYILPQQFDCKNYFKIVNKDYCSVFYKKILFQSFLFLFQIFALFLLKKIVYLIYQPFLKTGNKN